MYEIINSRFIKKIGFKHTNISTRKLIGVRGKESCIDEIMKVDMDINRY